MYSGIDMVKHEILKMSKTLKRIKCSKPKKRDAL